MSFATLREDFFSLLRCVDFLAWLQGKIAHVKMVRPDQGEKLYRQLRALLSPDSAERADPDAATASADHAASTFAE